MGKLALQTTHVLKLAWTAAHVLTHDAVYLDTMAVSDLMPVAELKRTVGIAYLQKLLGPAGDKLGERLRDAHAKLRIKLRKAQPEACVAEVDAWLAEADKSLASAPRGKKNCSCEACGAVVRNKPLKTPAKQKSHHKQPPDFTPRPTGRLHSMHSAHEGPYKYEEGQEQEQEAQG
jgi:hypothetical protein